MSYLILKDGFPAVTTGSPQRCWKDIKTAGNRDLLIWSVPLAFENYEENNLHVQLDCAQHSGKQKP